MADGIEIKISGIKEVNRSLFRYSQQLGDKVVIKSLREGAKLVQKEARSRAPRKSGLLRRSIVVRASKKFNKRKTPNTLGVYLTINNKKAFYGRFINDGWITARGKTKIKGIEFISKAWLSRRNASVDLIINAMKSGERIVRMKTRGIR